MKYTVLFLTLFSVFGCYVSEDDPKQEQIPVTIWTECDRVLDPLPMLFVDDRPTIREETNQNQAVVLMTAGEHDFDSIDIRTYTVPRSVIIEEVTGVELACGIDITGTYDMYDLPCNDPSRSLFKTDIRIHVYDDGEAVRANVIGNDFKEIGYLLQADLATHGTLELAINVSTGEINRCGNSRTDSGFYCPVE